MSTVVRTTGNTTQDIGLGGCRLAFTLSNGNALIVVRDSNADTTHSGLGDNTGVDKIYVMESSDRVTWTTRQTITVPAATARVTATLYSNNDLSIFHQSTASDIRHNKMTYSGYTLSGWETVFTHGTNEFGAAIDSHVTPEGWLICGFIWVNTSTNAQGYRIYMKPTSGGAWSNIANITLDTSATIILACSAISVTSSITNVIGGGTYRQLHYAVGASVASLDTGVTVYNHWINTTTFVQNAAPSSSGTVVGVNSLLQASTYTQGREAKFFKFNSKIWLGVINSVGSASFFAVSFVTSTSGLVQDITTGTGVVMPTGGSVPLTSLDHTLGIAFANGTFVFFAGWYMPTLSISFGSSKIARLSGSTFDVGGGGTSAWWSADDTFVNNDRHMTLAASGGDTNNNLNRVDTLFLVRNFAIANTPWVWRQEYNHLVATLRESDKSPANASTVNTSNPVFNGYYQQQSLNAQTRGTLQVQAAKDAAFSTSLKDFTGTAYSNIGAANFTSQWNYNLVSITTPALLYLVAGASVWYYRMRVVDEFGVVSAWTTTSTFTVTHPSSASYVTPNSGAYVEYGSGQVFFQWLFNDPWSSDFQTAYQLVIIRTDTSATVYDSGKVTSGNQFTTTTTLSTSLKTIPLAWKVQVWDSGDQTAGYISPRPFTILDGPVITVTAPTSGGTVLTPNPVVTFSATTYTSVVIKTIAVSIYQNGAQVFSTGVIPPPGSNAAGTTYNIQVTGNLLHNAGTYSVQVAVTDNWGITSLSALIPFTAAWTPPAAPTGQAATVASYDVDVTGGFVDISWTNATLDTAFLYYRIDRRDDQRNPDTGTIEQTGLWSEIGRVYTSAATMHYHDYLAPSGYSVNYRIVQVVSRFGDEVPSNPSTTVTVLPSSANYWIIDSLSTFIFRLTNVTADSFSDAYEESEYNIIGRGLHLDQGQHLGFTGTLTAQLRSGGGTSARYKRQTLQSSKDQSKQLYLRNPFGDVFRVAIKSMQIDRIAGTGISEFVDVTIPYDQVAV